MTRILLHIGLDQAAVARLQQVMADKREQMLAKGWLFPRAAGARNHTRLFMAVTEPERVEALRAARGYADPVAQAALRQELALTLARDIATHRPAAVILSASQLGSGLLHLSELARLRDLLVPLSPDIRIIAHVDRPAQMLARHYAAQVLEGRQRGLELEQALPLPGWAEAALALTPADDPARGRFAAVQGPTFWLDYAALVARWEGVFGQGTVSLRPVDMALFDSAGATEEIRAAFGIDATLGRATPATAVAAPAAAWISRVRQMNAMLERWEDVTGQSVPRPVWRKLMEEIRSEGPALDAAAVAGVTAALEAYLRPLLADQAALGADWLEGEAPVAGDGWQEADPGPGFRASQYLLAFRPRLERAIKAARAEAAADRRGADQRGASEGQTEAPRKGRNAGASEAPSPALTLTPAPAPASPRQGRSLPLGEAAARIMPPLAVENFHKLQASPFRPHNRLGMVDEEAEAAAFAPCPPRPLPPGSTGRVIVGCMKNEAPYIAEWVAYHRAIGVDNFLIYTNDCTDGTAEILDRMQAMGLLQHRRNDDWKGNSPQQSALNKAIREPVLRDAEWIIHIDVDEFINIRCDNGTLDDFLARVPGATNVAMTWRLFGHGGVTALADDFVTGQFEWCAPRFCPKPHTAWGFKTMFRNNGAYAKLSCHRPNKLDKSLRETVRWVNGSGQDMTREAAEKGWRNSVKSIGYDLLQLNHYALRSAESFLIKRQRGRALHVDRAIGINYWIRMDWCDVRDITIKRNLPRLRAEYDAMMQDGPLRALHQAGLDWHRAKAAELRATQEFRDLFDQALALKLTATERVAYALALDMES
jgi:hypothetical protein